MVSAYFDISRHGRSKEEYFEWIEKTLQLNSSFIFFTEAKFAEKIKTLIPKNKSVMVIKIELNELPYFNYLQSIKKILASWYYRKKIAHANRIECVNPLYSIVIYSKLDLLETAAKMNPFNSNQFIWVDAGISRFFGNFNLNLPFSTKSQLNDKFFTIFENRALNDKNFVDKDAKDILWSSKNYFQAGVMGGSYHVIREVNKGLKSTWQDMLKNGVVNNEQIGLVLLYFKQPHLFYFFHRTTLMNMEEIFIFLATK